VYDAIRDRKRVNATQNNSCFFLGDHFHFFSLKEFVFSFFHKNEKTFREINNATQIQLHVLKVMAHITPFFKMVFFVRL